ncbi:MAG TPA: FAD-dependent oxidoreductase [Luteolibacter sp.]|nr:FAD-dependent oxidoreductase [Luteolibacter sp.]
MSAPWTIVGQGLAGTCLAWCFWRRGVPFRIVDREQGGSSRVAAGLVNPVTGKNFEPTPHVAELLPEALEFYQELETRLDERFWHPLPIIRLAADDKEWSKMLAKCTRPDVARWLDGEPLAADGWCGALRLSGGGRLDTRRFLDASRAFFLEQAIYQKAEISHDSPPAPTIWCDGAAGLLTGRHGPHRCAKGEILTLRAPHWPQDHIRIGGGWLVPLGDGCFKAGATYEWDQLDEHPTPAGLEKVSSIARRLGVDDRFEVTAHEAGIRPIIRRSEPQAGPLGDGHWMFNGLGSKGSLTAPAIARRLADRIIASPAEG